MLSDADKATVAGYANRLEEVRWDRFLSYPDEDGHTCVIMYGWISREDGKHDFVLLLWMALDVQKVPHSITSSAKLTRSISDRMYSDQDWYDPEQHVDCVRVQDVFGGLIGNLVVI